MRVLALIFLALLLLLPISALAEEPRVITKQALEEMFQGMKESAEWDLSGPLLWGYYFTDESPEKLRDAGALLERQGYRVINIYRAEDGASSRTSHWWLHVEKVEQHTVDSLHQRNVGLYAFAAKYGLGAYDGMDVGAVDSTR